MARSTWFEPGALARLAAVVLPTLTLATLAVAILEETVGVPHASAVYLAAVVATALVAGTWGAIASAVASFVLYNLLFTEPRFTLRIADPGEWLSAVLLLFVGVVVGELAALERSRSVEARAREREARALFKVSRELVTRSLTADVLPKIAGILRDESAMRRIRVVLGADRGTEIVVADTAAADALAVPSLHRVLQRQPGDEPARWTTVHQPGLAPVRGLPVNAYRVRVEAGGVAIGAIWAFRERQLGDPDVTETRLLAAAADQIGLAITHDRLAREAQLGEIARQSDALKSALLQSLSHDLRTPLATIRTAAGTLGSGAVLSDGARQDSAESIEREVEYLNRLVTNLLDLGRIEGGALRADADIFEVEDLVRRTLSRLLPRMADRPVSVELNGGLIRVDPTFVDEALTNVVENVIKHTPAGTELRITSADVPEEQLVRVTIEDAGAGVAEDQIARIFDRFYQAPPTRRASRAGTGIGLAVARGLIEATGGRIGARRSSLGGLAVEINLPAAPARPLAGASR
jgi:two-component system sensor histidine kinase KdpD